MIKKISPIFICRILAISLMMVMVINVSDLIYSPKPVGLNYFYQIYAAPTDSSERYEIIKIICAVIRLALISLLIYALWGFKNVRTSTDALISYFSKNNNDKYRNVYPAVVFLFYILFIYLLKQYFPYMTKFVGIYGVVSTWNLFSDFGILDLNINCYQNGESPYARLTCNHQLGMNYSMLWVYLLGFIGFGSNSTVILDSHPFYIVIAILLVLFFVSIYYFIKDAFISKVYLLMILSSPIQTLYFQHNNDIFCVFILISCLYLIDKLNLKQKSYYHLALLTVLSAFKIIFLPVILIYSIYIYFSEIATSIIGKIFIILFPLLGLMINFIYVPYIVKFSIIPDSYTYGIRNFLLISKNFNIRRDYHGDAGVLVDLFGNSMESLSVSTLYASGYFFVLISIICIILSLNNLFNLTIKYSNAVVNYVTHGKLSRILELIFAIIYIFSYIVMPSYNLRLWCLVGAIISTCLNIDEIKSKIVPISNNASWQLKSVLQMLYVVLPIGCTFALYISPFPVFYFYISEVFFMVFCIFYLIHIINVFVKNIRFQEAC